MPIFDLTPGEHDIEISLPGYSLFKGTINVTDIGYITCVSVENGNCNSPKAPGILASGTIATCYLQKSTGGVCGWIGDKGGQDKLVAYDIMTLVKGYTGQENLGYNVRSADIMGAIAYYSGNKNSGNSLTGCSF